MKKLLLVATIFLGLNAFGQVPNYIPTDSLVGWWPFNGNADDESGNGYNGTVNGATLTTDRFGNANSAYSFDGDDYIVHNQGSDVDFSEGITLSCWAQITDTNFNNRDQFFVSKAEDLVDGHYKLMWNDDFTQLAGDLNQLSQGAVFSSATNYTVPFDTTYHMVLTYDNDTLRLYVNGILDAFASYTAGLPNITADVYFGKHDTPVIPATYPVVGTLDDIAIWNRPLTGCEVQDVYNAQLNSTDFTLTQTGTLLTANQIGANYQWLDCDNNYTWVLGETNQAFTPSVTGNYAVEINMSGCIDTSSCALVDYTGIEELIIEKKELVMILDFMGREVEFKPNTPLIFIYRDGTRERVMEIEN